MKSASVKPIQFVKNKSENQDIIRYLTSSPRTVTDLKSDCKDIIPKTSGCKTCRHFDSWCNNVKRDDHYYRALRLAVEYEYPCVKCGSIKNNSFCLDCKKVYCGQDTKHHMLHHYEEEHHNLAFVFEYLAVWCFSCRAFFVNETTQKLVGVCNRSDYFKIATPQLKGNLKSTLGNIQSEPEDFYRVRLIDKCNRISKKSTCDHFEFWYWNTMSSVFGDTNSEYYLFI